MTFTYITMGMLAVAAILLLFTNRRLRKRNESLHESFELSLAQLRRQSKIVSDAQNLHTFRFDFREENLPYPHFAVYARGYYGEVPVLRIPFSPNDKDDKEYKRVFARERVESLNEKP